MLMDPPLFHPHSYAMILLLLATADLSLRAVSDHFVTNEFRNNWGMFAIARREVKVG